MTDVVSALGLAGFAWLVLFQLGLALGLPYGHLAWGGAHRVLPRGLRWGSLASAGLAALGGVTIAQAVGWLGPVLPSVTVRPILAALAILFALSFVGNAASQSRAERWHGVPLTLILAGSTAWLAITS